LYNLLIQINKCFLKIYKNKETTNKIQKVFIKIRNEINNNEVELLSERKIYEDILLKNIIIQII